MKKKKIILSKLSISSFVTEIDKFRSKTIVAGGDSNDPSVKYDDCHDDNKDEDKIGGIDNLWTLFCAHDASNICGNGNTAA